MQNMIGQVSTLSGIVKAVDPITGAERILSAGSPIYENEIIKTSIEGKVEIGLFNGENMVIEANQNYTLPADLNSIETIDLEKSLQSLRTLDLDKLPKPAAEGIGVGDIALPAGVVVERIAGQGNVPIVPNFNVSGLNVFAALGIASGANLPIVERFVDTITVPINDPNLLERLLGPSGDIDDVITSVAGLADGLLNTRLSYIALPFDHVTTDVQRLLTGDQNLPDTLRGLLGDQGSVDQLVGGLTKTLDSLLNTNLSALDGSVDNLTTGLQAVLTGDQSLADALSGLALGDLGRTVNMLLSNVQSSILGQTLSSVVAPLDNALTVLLFPLDNTLEALLGEQGSVDLTVAIVTYLADSLLSTKLFNLYLPLDHLTTDVQQLLTGDVSLPQSLSNLLGNEGSVDQVVGGLTDVLDGLLSTNLSALDKPVDNLTTGVQELLTGERSLGDLLGGVYDEAGLSQAGDDLAEGVKSLLGGSGSGLGSLGNGLGDTLGTVGSSLGDLGENLGDSLAGLLGDDGALDNLLSNLGGTVNNVTGDNGLGAVGGVVEDVVQGVDHAVIEPLGNTLDYLVGSNSALGNVLNNLI